MNHGLDAGYRVQVAAHRVLGHVVAIHGVRMRVGIGLRITCPVEVAQSIPLVFRRNRATIEFIDNAVAARVEDP